MANANETLVVHILAGPLDQIATKTAPGVAEARRSTKYDILYYRPIKYVSYLYNYIYLYNNIYIYM